MTYMPMVAPTPALMSQPLMDWIKMAGAPTPELPQPPPPHNAHAAHNLQPAMRGISVYKRKRGAIDEAEGAQRPAKRMDKAGLVSSGSSGSSRSTLSKGMCIHVCWSCLASLLTQSSRLLREGKSRRRHYLHLGLVYKTILSLAILFKFTYSSGSVPPMDAPPYSIHIAFFRLNLKSARQTLEDATPLPPSPPFSCSYL